MPATVFAEPLQVIDDNLLDTEVCFDEPRKPLLSHDEGSDSDSGKIHVDTTFTLELNTSAHPPQNKARPTASNTEEDDDDAELGGELILLDKIPAIHKKKKGIFTRLAIYFKKLQLDEVSGIYDRLGLAKAGLRDYKQECRTLTRFDKNLSRGELEAYSTIMPAMDLSIYSILLVLEAIKEAKTNNSAFAKFKALALSTYYWLLKIARDVIRWSHPHTRLTPKQNIIVMVLSLAGVGVAFIKSVIDFIIHLVKRRKINRQYKQFISQAKHQAANAYYLKQQKTEAPPKSLGNQLQAYYDLRSLIEKQLLVYGIGNEETNTYVKETTENLTSPLITKFNPNETLAPIIRDYLTALEQINNTIWEPYQINSEQAKHRIYKYSLLRSKFETATAELTKQKLNALKQVQEDDLISILQSLPDHKSKTKAQLKDVLNNIHAAIKNEERFARCENLVLKMQQIEPAFFESKSLSRRELSHLALTIKNIALLQSKEKELQQLIENDDDAPADLKNTNAEKTTGEAKTDHTTTLDLLYQCHNINKEKRIAGQRINDFIVRLIRYVAIIAAIVLFAVHTLIASAIAAGTLFVLNGLDIYRRVGKSNPDAKSYWAAFKTFCSDIAKNKLTAALLVITIVGTAVSFVPILALQIATASTLLASFVAFGVYKACTSLSLKQAFIKLKFKIKSFFSKRGSSSKQNDNEIELRPRSAQTGSSYKNAKQLLAATAPKQPKKSSTPTPKLKANIKDNKAGNPAQTRFFRPPESTLTAHESLIPPVGCLVL